MVNNKSFTNIRVILDSCLEHELLQDLTLEQLVGYVRRFIGLFNMPDLYIDKIEEVQIKDHRGELPCDLISVIQVKDKKRGTCLRYKTSTFPNNIENVFVTQGRYIYTSFKNRLLEVAYKAIPVDDEGYPLILDNEIYKETLETYIKLNRFTRYFEMGKLPISVLQNVQQEYCWCAGRLNAELNLPSVSELESLSNAHNHLLLKDNEFVKGFATKGIREDYYIH